MTELSSPRITEINVGSATFTLLAEWLRGWFNGSLHAVGQNALIQFPATNIAFGQGAPVQPLYRPADGSDSEIRVVMLPRTEQQESLDTALFSGKLATDKVLFNFFVSSKHPGKGQSSSAAQRIADLLKAMLANPESRLPLALKGILELAPQAPQVISSTDFHKRLVACSAQLQYPILYDPQPVPPVLGEIEVLPQWSQSLEFYNEDPVLTGNYLIGTYTAPCTMKLGAVTADYWPSQEAEVVLGLEVDGVMTSFALTLPVGTANEDTTTTGDLAGMAVTTGQVLKWKVISAPAAELSAWHLAVEMVGVPQPG